MDLTTSTEAHNSGTILGSMLYTLWEGTCDYLKRRGKKRGSSLEPPIILATSTPIMKLEATILLM